MATKKQEEMLKFIISEAERKGWSPDGHEDGQRVATEVNPGYLRFNTETLIKDGSFKALILETGFLQALVEDNQVLVNGGLERLLANFMEVDDFDVLLMLYGVVLQGHKAT